MYRDNSLIPREAIRLLALGILAEHSTSYAALAEQVRHFTGRIVGPSLDLVAQPLELLKVEGLVESAGSGQDDLLTLTEAGREELHRLLGANVRPQINDLNKLIIAIKVRFLHLLPPKERQVQTDILTEIFERELARLSDLRAQDAAYSKYLSDWLDLEIKLTRERLAWFEALGNAQR